MVKKYTIHAPNGITERLIVLKKIKELTELGLKDAKYKMDELNQQRSMPITLEFDIDYGNNTILVSDLKELGINFGDDRESNLNEMLTKFKVTHKEGEMLYRVFDGDYEIFEHNIIKLTIKEGNKESTKVRIDFNEINDIIIVLPFNQCIVEENF